MNTKIIAHRGASDYAPENTMEAFDLAHKMKSDGLELDVRLTKDGQPVVIHDSSIDRTSDGKGYVEQMTYRELLMYDFSYKFSEKYKNVKIPLLRDVLCFVKDTGLILNIEIKFGECRDNGIEQKIVSLVDEFNIAQQIIISSFNHYSLVRIKNLCPKLVTAPLYSCGLYQPWVYAGLLGAEGIHPAASSINTDETSLCRKNGLFVNVWTVNDPQDIKKYAIMGVDAIITNVPDIARTVLNRKD